MAEEPLKSVINELTFGKIQEEVMEGLEKLLKEGFDAARKNNFPVHSYFKEKYRDVLEREGLIDAWLSFICFCIFAQGVSVERGAKKIEKKDISKTRDKICDKWPDCTVMRLKAFSSALSNVMLWYDEQTG